MVVKGLRSILGMTEKSATLSSNEEIDIQHHRTVTKGLLVEVQGTKSSYHRCKDGKVVEYSMTTPIILDTERDGRIEIRFNGVVYPSCEGQQVEYIKTYIKQGATSQIKEELRVPGLNKKFDSIVITD